MVDGSFETLNSNSIYQELQFKYTLDVSSDVIDETRNFDDSTAKITEIAVTDETRNFDDSIAKITEIAVTNNPNITLEREIKPTTTVSTLATTGGKCDNLLSLHERKNWQLWQIGACKVGKIHPH